MSTQAECPEHYRQPLNDCHWCKTEIATADRDSGVAKVRAAIAATGIAQRTNTRRTNHMTPALRAELDRISNRRTPTQQAETPEADTTQEDQ